MSFSRAVRSISSSTWPVVASSRAAARALSAARCGASAPGLKRPYRSSYVFTPACVAATGSRCQRRSKYERSISRNGDRKSTRLNSSHGYISYAVFCLKKKKNKKYHCDHTKQKHNMRELSVHRVIDAALRVQR